MATTVTTEKKVDGDCGCDGGRLECNCGADCQCPECPGCDGCDKSQSKGSKGGCCGGNKKSNTNNPHGKGIIEQCPALAKCPAFADGCPFADGKCPFANGGSYNGMNGYNNKYGNYSKCPAMKCPAMKCPAMVGPHGMKGMSRCPAMRCPAMMNPHGCGPFGDFGGFRRGPPHPHGHGPHGRGGGNDTNTMLQVITALGVGGAIGYLYGKLSNSKQK